MPAIAHFSGKASRGIVFSDGAIYIIEASKMNQPKPAGTIDIDLWLGGFDDVQTMEAGPFPFVAVYKLLEAAVDAAHAGYLWQHFM